MQRTVLTIDAIQHQYNQVKKEGSGSEGKEQQIDQQSYSIIYQCINAMMSPHNVNLWTRIGKKEDGANEAGEEGGFYQLSNNPDIKAFFKQDPVIAKNIGEFIASYVMRELAEMIGFPKECIAQVELAFVDINDAKPNLSGDNVYVASVIYPDFLELYKDAYLAFNFSPQYENLRNDYPLLLNRPFPKKRPGLFEKDPIIELMIQHGRYQQLNGLLQLSRSVDDPDVHFGNIGTIPKATSNQEISYKLIEVDKKGKMTEIKDSSDLKGKDCKRYKVYENIDSVRIDFGAAFGDERLIKRTYNQDKLNKNLFMTWLTYHPSKAGPPPYFRNIPKLVREDPSALTWLAKIATVDEKNIKRIFKAAIEKVGEKYGVHPIGEFATLAGMLQNSLPNNLEELKSHLCKYMVECFRHFQQSSLTYYQSRVKTLNLESKEEIQEIKGNKEEIKVKLSDPEQKEVSYRRGDYVATIMEQLLRLDEILNEQNPDLLKIGPIYTSLIAMRVKLSNNKPEVSAPQSGISDEELFASHAEIKSMMEAYQLNVAILVAQDRARQLFESDHRLSVICTALSNPKIVLRSLGSAEEFIATAELIKRITQFKDDSFVASLEPLLKKQVGKFQLANQTLPVSGIDQNAKVKIARADALYMVEEALAAQLEYEQVLVACSHNSLIKTKEEVIKKHRLFIANILRAITNADTEEKYNRAAFLLKEEREGIQQATELVESLNKLHLANQKYVNNPNIVDPLKHYGRVMYNEAAQTIAGMIVKPKPKKEELYEMGLLSETLNETEKAVTDPFSANYKRLRSNVNELSGKSSKFKRVGGIAGIILSIACGVAAALVMVGVFACLAPSGGASLLGVPLAVWLFGMASGISLFAGAATLFQSRCKGVAKVTTRIADEVEVKHKERNVQQPVVADIVALPPPPPF